MRQENGNAHGREGADHDPIHLHTACRMTLVPCIVPRGGDHCDFCCSSPIAKFYNCANFESSGRAVFAFGSAVGSWAACRKCAELVDKGRWSDLTDRAFRKFAQRHGLSRYEGLPLRQQFRDLHQLFREHMIREL